MFAEVFWQTCGVSGRPNLERFGRIVRERREQLGYQQDSLPQGPSSTTVSDIENGDAENPAAKTFRKLDESLKWEPGSARQAFEGGNPTPVESRVPLDLKTVSSDALLIEIRRRLAAVGHRDGGRSFGDDFPEWGNDPETPVNEDPDFGGGLGAAGRG